MQTLFFVFEICRSDIGLTVSKTKYSNFCTARIGLTVNASVLHRDGCGGPNKLPDDGIVVVSPWQAAGSRAFETVRACLHICFANQTPKLAEASTAPY